MKSVLLSLLFTGGLAHAHPAPPADTEKATEAPAANPVASPVMGALKKAEIDTVFSANKGRIQGCYDQGLKEDPDISGRVLLKVVIGNTGAVSKSEVKETTLNHADTEACMVEVAKSLQFPKPEGGGIVIVSYPFVLSGTE